MTKVFLEQDIPKELTLDAAHSHSAAFICKLYDQAPLVIRPITQHILQSPGKGVRTSLLLASAMQENGKVPKEAIVAAAAVEIFHMATLVHDDVIDEADTRRGIASVQSKFSKKKAILCGDYLFCLSFAAISSIYEPYTAFAEKFATSASQICLGEMRQYGNNYNAQLELYDYLKTIRGKTAALFHISAYGGALLGGETEKECRLLGRFGTYLGMIFQILDDCKDYILNPEQAKKPTNSDIAAGVVNLPLLMAYFKEPSLRDMPFTVDLIRDVHRLDGVSAALELAKKYEKKARKIVASLENQNKSAYLEQLMDDILRKVKEAANGK